MTIKKCHLCQTPIYPGEIRYRILIGIYPDYDDDGYEDDLISEDGQALEGDAAQEDEVAWEESGECFWAESQAYGELEIPREAHLILCEECQESFLNSPFVKENILFLRKDPPQKTLH